MVAAGCRRCRALAAVLKLWRSCVRCYNQASDHVDLATVTTTKNTRQTLKTVVDRRFVADCTFDAKPVFDENGKWVGTVPNTEQRAYEGHAAHRDAPTGFRLRVDRPVKARILVQRQAGKVVTTTVGRHPECRWERMRRPSATPGCSRERSRPACDGARA